MSQYLEIVRSRPVIYDGSMGAYLLNMELTAEDYGGKEGCNDFLVLSKPGVIEDVHTAYLEAGADVLCFEPMTALEPIVAKYGQTHGLIASKVDARTLTFGPIERIKAEIDATLPLARQCRGFMFAVGNHIPSNVPVEYAQFYMDYLRQNWYL